MQASSQALVGEGEGLCGIMSRYLMVAEATAELSAAPTEEFAALLDYLADIGQVSGWAGGRRGAKGGPLGSIPPETSSVINDCT